MVGTLRFAHPTETSVIASEASNPFFFPPSDGLLRYARNDVTQDASNSRGASAFSITNPSYPFAATSLQICR